MYSQKMIRRKYTSYICFVLMWINIFTSINGYSFEPSDEINRYGKLSNKFISQSNSSNNIIHIKDLHCNSEIQHNISEILNIICKNNQVNLIGIEGAAGQIDTSVFQVFPDNKVKQDVCGNFVKKGLLSGTEYFAICQANTLRNELWGLENTVLYKNNLNQFRETKTIPTNILDEISLIEAELMSLKQQLYPSLLYAFEVSHDEYSECLLNIKEWIAILSDYAGKAGINLEKYQSLNIYNKLNSKSSSLNFSKINQELDLLYNNNLGSLNLKEHQNLKKLIFNFRIGKITLNSLINSLHNINNVNLEGYEFLKIANQLAGLEQNSNTGKLTDELEILTQDIKKSILKSLKNQDNVRYSDCLNLDSLSHHIRLLCKLCSLTLSYDEWQTYNQNRHYSIPSIIQRIKKIGENNNIPLTTITAFRFSPDYRKITTSAEQFYRTADKRSLVMANNLFAKMRENNSSNAVIITGGYHSEAIEQYLKQKEISFCTIQPNASQNVSNDLYLSLLMQDSIYPNETSADNIAFPIVCENNLSNSYFFNSIRRQLAKELIAHQKSASSISEFTSDLIYLRNPNIRATFHNLLFIAGVDISQLGTVDELLASIEPEKVAQQIARFDDYTIKLLSKEWDNGYDETKFQYNLLYSDYLISILELAVYLKDPQADASEYLKKIIRNTRHSNYNYIHTAAQQRDYDITRKNMSLLDKTTQDNFSFFNHGETATQYEVYLNEDRTILLKVKRKFVETLKIRFPQILNNYRLFFGDLIVFGALKLCGKKQIERIMLASNRLGGLVPKTSPFKSDIPLKIYDSQTDKTHYIYEGVLQERIDFPLSTMIERYTEENNPQKVNAFIDQIFDIQEKMWERGVFDIDPHFWRNYGFIDPGFKKLVCFDVGMLTDNLKIAEFVIRFFRRYNNYISSQLKGKMPEESIVYFQEKYQEIFTVDNLNKKWNTAPPVSAWLDYYQDFDSSMKRTITRAAFSTAMNSPLRNTDITRARLHIIQFLKEIRLNDNQELIDKLNEVIKDFFYTGNSDIFRNKLQAGINQEIFMQIIALQKSSMFQPLMELVSKIMRNDPNTKRAAVLSLAFQVAITEFADSNPTYTTKKSRDFAIHELIDKSL